MPEPSSRRFTGKHIGGIALVALLGIFAGLSLFTFTYARGASYLSDDPTACINCHIMQEQFDAWGHSSHRNVATCNDCHTASGFVGKWASKGINGWNHGVAFTLNNFHEPIQIKPFNADIVQYNCVSCHEPLVESMHMNVAGQELQCVACHGNVGHRNR